MEIVRAKDTGTLQYEIYFSNDESECIVVERYQDSEALLEHAANLGELGGQSMRRVGCLRLVPGAAGGAAVDAAGAVAEGLVPGAAAGAQRGAGLSQRPLGGVQDKIAADQQWPPGVRGDDGRRRCPRRRLVMLMSRYLPGVPEHVPWRS
jgi:hypothetical protein